MELQNNFIEMRIFEKGEYQGRYLIKQEDIKKKKLLSLKNILIFLCT